MDNGLLQGIDKISRGKKEPDALHGAVEIGEGDGGSGKKNKRKPEELIEDLCLLHGIGDAGDNQAKRSKGNRADAYEDKNAGEVADGTDVENEAGEDEFGNDGGERESKIRDDTGSKHVGGGHGSDVKAAKNALFAEHDQRGAEAPKAAHDVESQNRAEIKSAIVWNAFGKDAKPEEEETERHDDAEKEKHFVAQRQADAHARQGGEVPQSRSLLPVISMKTSSSEGEAISRLISSLPPASRCLTSETMVWGGRCVCRT